MNMKIFSNPKLERLVALNPELCYMVSILLQNVWMQDCKALLGYPRVKYSILINCQLITLSLNYFSMSYTLNISLATEAQNDIGWQAMAEGWTTEEWAVIQQEYCKLIGFRKTGKRWLV
jgi:hypothetical protein